jgi:hypothetical protein
MRSVGFVLYFINRYETCLRAMHLAYHRNPAKRNLQFRYVPDGKIPSTRDCSAGEQSFNYISKTRHLL